jgi:hypothetical protein
MQNRRDFLLRTAAAAASAAMPALAKSTDTIGLGLGNYGLRAFPIGEDIKFIAKNGYDSVERTLMRGYATEPAKVSPQERRKIRAALAE